MRLFIPIVFFFSILGAGLSASAMGIRTGLLPQYQKACEKKMNAAQATSWANSSTSPQQSDTSSTNESDVGTRCRENPDDFSVTCVRWASKKAVAAIDMDEKCKGKINSSLLMCIFRKEVYWKPKRVNSGQLHEDEVVTKPNKYCGRQTCGLAQMTEYGVLTVLEGYSRYGLGTSYDHFWKLVNPPPGKSPNKCEININSAASRDQSAIMAATHLCVQVKRRRKKNRNITNQVLARDYNGSSDKERYSLWVNNCIERKSDQTLAWSSSTYNSLFRVQAKASARRYNKASSHLRTRVSDSSSSSSNNRNKGSSK